MVTVIERSYAYAFCKPPEAMHGPMTGVDLRKQVQTVLRNKTLPNIHRAIDVLQALGYLVFKQVAAEADVGGIRLPEHLKERK